MCPNCLMDPCKCTMVLVQLREPEDLKAPTRQLYSHAYTRSHKNVKLIGGPEDFCWEMADMLTFWDVLGPSGELRSFPDVRSLAFHVSPTADRSTVTAKVMEHIRLCRDNMLNAHYDRRNCSAWTCEYCGHPFTGKDFSWYELFHHLLWIHGLELSS